MNGGVTLWAEHPTPHDRATLPVGVCRLDAVLLVEEGEGSAHAVGCVPSKPHRTSSTFCIPDPIKRGSLSSEFPKPHRHPRRRHDLPADRGGHSNRKRVRLHEVRSEEERLHRPIVGLHARQFKPFANGKGRSPKAAGPSDSPANRFIHTRCDDTGSSTIPRPAMGAIANPRG